MSLYYLTLTQTGAAAIAAAHAGRPVVFSHLAIGNANDQPYLPISRIDATALVNELARVDVQNVSVTNNVVNVVATIPASVGGFHFHELGLFDVNNQLLYLGNWHGGYKPALSEGAAGDIELVLTLDTSGLADVTLQLDPTVVIANRDWVDKHYVTIPTFNAAMDKNESEHGQILNTLNAHVAQEAIDHQALLDRIIALEQREEIQIGEFIITDKPENPVTYKKYGAWRLVPNVLLYGADAGGTVGQYSQLSSGHDRNARLTYFWQRFDPETASSLQIINITQDVQDLVLSELYTQTYGAMSAGIIVKFIVASGVHITASSTDKYAVTTGDWPLDSSVTLENNGIISGHGGDGGNAYFYSHIYGYKSGIGGNGGPAVFAAYPLALNNLGVVAGGGGGGGCSPIMTISRTVTGSAAITSNTLNNVAVGLGGKNDGKNGVKVEGFNSAQDEIKAPDYVGMHQDAGINAKTTDGQPPYYTGGTGGELGQRGQDGSTNIISTPDWSSAQTSGGAGGNPGIALAGSIALTGNPPL